MTSDRKLEPNHSINTKAVAPVTNGSSDWRNYRPLSLPNGITCVLVNDKESKTTSCAVSVGAGASADPRDLSGLAHFTEHMSFLGSEAYPKENEFKQYLSAHGGRSNASTSMSSTTYKFDVLADHAEKVIDIFSNFFIAPLFTQSGTNREVNAVDSENSKNESNDARRRLQILKALADPLHHYSKFSTGNIKTLPAVDGEKAAFVREALLAFHKRHYRPDNMTVVVVGPQDLDLLEEWIVPRFAKIVNRFTVKDRKDMTKAEKLVDDSAKDLTDDSFGSPSVPFHSAFRPELQNGKWPVLLTTLPLKSMRKLFLYFPLPSTRDLGDQSPYAMLCHLLGHEGSGSCFAALQDAELVDSLSVGARLSDADQSLLQINISLTEKGEESWEHVVNILFEYCEMLLDLSRRAKNGDENDLNTLKRIWDEIYTLRALNFHQTSPNQAYSLAPSLANSVRKNGTEKCLSLGSLLDESKDSLPLDNVLGFMEKVKPENCIVERCSNAAWNNLNEGGESNEDFGFQTEKWYGVRYHLSPIDQSTVDSWKGITATDEKSSIVGTYKLHLPDENNHIPRDLSMCADLSEKAKEAPQISKVMDAPKLLINDGFGRLWHRLDDRYCLPKSILSILIRNPEIENVFNDATNEWSYDTSASFHSAILISVFQDALAQQMYDAELAGLHWNLSKTSSGLHLSFSGYSSANNQHLVDFALNIISRFFANQEGVGDSFLMEKHFRTNKDKYLRSLNSYLESKRADSYAMYYTDLVLSSQGKGIEHAIAAAESITLDGVKEHHQRLISNSASVECLFGGNVGERDAKEFFTRSQDLITTARTSSSQKPQKWIPGPFERRLEAGEEIQLHFQSQNKEEQNGSVVITYQSTIPSFQGRTLSKPGSLVQSAAIRTLCHMLREPLFNQLRTKEQLGYIVGSYYNNSPSSVSTQLDSSAGSADDIVTLGTTHIDSIVVNVLSKKVPPPIITQRIDEFLGQFREKLRNLPEEELKSHTDALSKKLLKPHQKLGDEIGIQMRKITNHAPEILNNGMSPSDFPWDSKTELAATIQKLTSSDLLKAWDNVVAGKKRARIVSHVYGSSFPLSDIRQGDFQARNSNQVVKLHSIKGIQEKRQMLVQYSETNVDGRTLFPKRLQKRFGIALGVVGVSCFIYAINAWARKDAPVKGATHAIKSK